MKLELLYEELKKLPVPVSMIKTKNIKPPYILFYREKDIPFYADGINYYNRVQLSIELYTKNINLDLEKAIEKLLTDQGFFYEKYYRFLEDEMLNLALYELIIQGENDG